MPATRLIKALKNLLRKTKKPSSYQGKSFQTLALPWRIAQVEDEEDPSVP